MSTPATTPPRTSDDPGRPPARALAVVVALCFGGLAASLTQTLVVPLQGELATLLDTSPANAGWVVTVTLLAAAVTMPISGRLGDLFGKQRVLAVSAAVLAVGSVVCALSSSITPMLAGRALQGLAMGFIPVGIALLREVTPPHLTSTAIAAMSATLGVGGAIGLPLSAWVAQTFDWHALFWMSAVFAVLVLVAVLVVVPHVADAVGGRVDVVGALGLALGLVGVLLGVSKGGEWGWTDGRTLGAIGGGVVVLLAWGLFELRHPDPLCDLRVAARRPVLLTNLAAVAIGFGMMAQAVVMPQLLQLPEATGVGLGQTMLQAGLWMAPGGLMMLVFAPVSAQLLGAVGARVTLMVGGAVLSLGYVVAFAFMQAPWELMVAGIVASAGVGIGYAAMPTLVLGAVPVSVAGAAVGLNALMRSVGTTCAAAVMAAVLTGSVGPTGVPSSAAFETCFLVGAGAALLGVLITAFVPREPRRALAPVSPAAVADPA